MTRKLMKYEWLSTRRMILPFYVLMVSIAFINGLFFRFEKTEGIFHDIAKMILISSQIVIVIASFLFVVYWMLRRFYKNIYSDEGYLTHTLPVKSWQHILAKLIVASLWEIGTFFVLLVSLFLLGLIVAPDSFQELWKEIILRWEEIKQIILEEKLVSIAVEFSVSMILIVLFFYTKAYCSISFGHMMPRHKILSSIGVYIGLGFIENILSSIVFFNSFSKISNLDTVDTVEDFSGVLSWFHELIFISMWFYIVGIIVYFFITKYVIDKQLNI